MSPAPSTRSSVLALAVAVLICLSAGALGGIATAENVNTWYATLTKPSWNPPSWIFAPVWTTLYLMMAVAAWQVWRSATPPTSKRIALTLFGVQLALNSLWSFIFFEWHQLGWATVEIVVLWLAIVATIVTFYRLSKLAGVLMLPYLTWVSFASLLTWTIWRLNG